MIELTEQQKHEIQKHAIAEYERGEFECCGFVLNDGTILNAENVAATHAMTSEQDPAEEHPDNPKSYFVADPETSAKAERSGYVAIYHSHANGNGDFTDSDGAQCKKSGVPWVLYDVHHNAWNYLDPSGDAPYLGRRFCWGVYDCYSLIRDYYRREFGIVWDDFVRPNFKDEDGIFFWQKPDFNMFEEHYATQDMEAIAGDVSTTSVQKGDVLLMAMHGGNVNHIGVITEDGQFMHQLANKTSRLDVWGDPWKSYTIKILRRSREAENGND